MGPKCPLYVPMAVIANHGSNSIPHAIAAWLLESGYDFEEVVQMMRYDALYIHKKTDKGAF